MAELTRRQAAVEQRPLRWLPIVITAFGALVAAAALIVSLVK
jgi:multidrug efflux pump subunit AcrB